MIKRQKRGYLCVTLKKHTFYNPIKFIPVLIHSIHMENIHFYLEKLF